MIQDPTPNPGGPGTRLIAAGALGATPPRRPTRERAGTGPARSARQVRLRYGLRPFRILVLTQYTLEGSSV